MPGLRRVLVAAIVLLTLFSPMARAADLAYTLGPQGLASLSYRGQARLGDGRLQVVNTTPRFGRADAPQGGETPTATRFDAKGRMLTQTYPWGRLVGIYDQRGDSLTLRLTVRNDTPDTLTALDVQVAELTFPSVPQGDTADPGMFGTGGPHPLEYPLSADPRNTPPVLLIDDGTGGVLDFASEGVTDPVTVSVPFSTNPPTRTRYPFWASVGNIAPGASRTFTVALRFGPPGASPVALARDLYKKYAAAYPFRVHWTDRRPIGTDFLATSEAHPAKNPRGWFLNAADADTTTAEGRAAFRRRLMDYADASVKVLKGMNAQGVITWDPEGQEYGHSTYYGDPRLVTRLAPEMEDRDASGVATVDAYFQKFRAAGLRVGVCVRPQQIRFVDGTPIQEDSPDPARTLEDKIAYAKRRWGCTLFYVDSTVDAAGHALNPDIFEAVTRAYPDVLLMPENQTTRDYACTAPFDSFFHHGVTSTPAGVRAVYPRAFSALYAPDNWSGGSLAANHDKLTAAVRRGDILLFHGWYDAPANAEIRRIYADAARPEKP